MRTMIAWLGFGVLVACRGGSEESPTSDLDIRIDAAPEFADVEAVSFSPVDLGAPMTTLRTATFALG